ncbi:helix-turn-helix transcriptional regulator [Clavibacter michiganensis]|uniref:Transcriptional regulatory protein LiaR n=1 Tax=Clavibacter michiganensis TaxID=28447 RepID=A0A251YJB2_9MICO|nr:LuxR C-terminal-related transcriptional regulator [Clavibacter michiganensis]OUE24335.1 Transcriptional regulatory protein LiaR [Clavibacter michiganensis]
MEGIDTTTVVVATSDHMHARLLRDALARVDDVSVVGYALGTDGLDDLLLLAEPEVVLMDRELFASRAGRGRDPEGAAGPGIPPPRGPACVVVCDPFTSDDGAGLVREGAHAALHLRAPAAALAGALRVVAAGGSAVAGGGGDGGDDGAALAWADLTSRERDVLECVLLGWSNVEIADEITLSPETVKSHVAALMRKLECRNRVALAVRAYQMGARP